MVAKNEERITIHLMVTNGQISISNELAIIWPRLIMKLLSLLSMQTFYTVRSNRVHVIVVITPLSNVAVVFSVNDTVKWKKQRLPSEFCPYQESFSLPR